MPHWCGFPDAADDVGPMTKEWGSATRGLGLCYCFRGRWVELWKVLLDLPLWMSDFAALDTVKAGNPRDCSTF